MQITLIKAEDGSEEKIDRKLTLEEMQKYVGGRIECVEFPDGRTLVVNEEGKLVDMPVLNKKATDIWKEQFPIEKYPIGGDDIVVGDVLITSADYPWNEE